MRIFPNGWCDEAAIRPSEHFNERPEGEEISLLVIHNISLPAGQFGTGDVDALFCGTLDCCKHPSYQNLEGLRVSSHFFIDRSGRLFQYVSCLDRAWHAGVSSYEGRENCNDFSIGVELEGTDSAPYEQAQYETLGRLTDALAEAYPIKYVTGHSMIAPRRIRALLSTGLRMRVSARPVSRCVFLMSKRLIERFRPKFCIVDRRLI